MAQKNVSDLAEWNSTYKPLPTREEMEHGIVPEPRSHRDLGRHLLPLGKVSVPSGRIIPISGTYHVLGPIEAISYFQKGEEAPFIEHRGHLWVLEEES